MLNYLDRDIHELHHGQVELPVLQLVLEVVPSRHAYIGTTVLWPLKTGEYLSNNSHKSTFCSIFATSRVAMVTVSILCLVLSRR